MAGAFDKNAFNQERLENIAQQQRERIKKQGIDYVSSEILRIEEKRNRYNKEEKGGKYIFPYEQSAREMEENYYQLLQEVYQELEDYNKNLQALYEEFRILLSSEKKLGQAKIRMEKTIESVTSYIQNLFKKIPRKATVVT